MALIVGSVALMRLTPLPLLPASSTPYWYSTMSFPRDVHLFLANYPGYRDDIHLSANLRFHSNELRCQPSNLLIDEIHKKWFGDYNELEHNHGFIQWLFPIQEDGVNYQAQALQKHEIEAMKSRPEILERLISSYKLMLNFYGMRLVSLDTGLLDHAFPPTDYAARYRNLLRSSHNNLRITRILKCLSEMGLERLNAGFLLFVLKEQSEHHQLDSPQIRNSMDTWWANCIRNDDERRWIGEMISEVRHGCMFTGDMYQKVLQARVDTGRLQSDRISTGPTNLS